MRELRVPLFVQVMREGLCEWLRERVCVERDVLTDGVPVTDWERLGGDGVQDGVSVTDQLPRCDLDLVAESVDCDGVRVLMGVCDTEKVWECEAREWVVVGVRDVEEEAE